jgi:endonuclease III
VGKPTARELVERLGPHPAAALGIDPCDEEGVGRWFIAACLLAGRAGAAAAGDAYRALARDGLPSPREIAKADPARIARGLAEAGYPKPEIAAQKLARASATLVERWGGSLVALAADADDLADLGERIARLAPGVGPATAALFLRPLRDTWIAARELPLSPAARAAALHLGLLREGEDEEGEPGALRAALAAQPDAPSLNDAESALERLGRRACLRERVRSCPLGDDCPAREHDVARGHQRE